MAELPRYQQRYQQTGTVNPDVSQLNFANVREAFQASRLVNSGLDRLSQFAFEETGKQTLKKAQQYSIDNPITVEDLKSAGAEGLTALDLVEATGGGSIWQDTVRKFQAVQLRTELEVKANAAAMDISHQVDMNELSNIGEIKDKFNALQFGMSKQLTELDPEEGLKFQAKNASIIQTLEKKSLETSYNNYKLSKQVETKNYEIVALESVSAVFDVETDPDLINAKVSTIRATFASFAKEGGDDFALKAVNDLDKQIQNLRISSLVKSSLSEDFATNSFEAMSKIRNGDFGNKTAFYNSLNSQEQKEVRVAVKNSWDDLSDSRNKKEKHDKETAEDSFRVNAVGNKKRTIFDQAFIDGVLPYPQWKEADAPSKESKTDPILISQIRNRILDGNMTDMNQLPKGLSPKEIATFNNLIHDTDGRNAVKLLRNDAKIPSGSLFATESQSAKFAKLSERYEFNLNSKTPNGEPVYKSKVEAAEAAISSIGSSIENKTATAIQKSAAIRVRKITETFDMDKNYDIKKLSTWANKNYDKEDAEAFLKAYELYKKQAKNTGLTFNELGID